MNVQRARIETKRCPMADENCAARVIGLIEGFYTRDAAGQLTVNVREIIEKACGRYVRGKNKGKLRGWASIEVVTAGGWQVLGPGAGNGRVVRPGTVIGIKIEDFVGHVYYDVAH